MRRLMSVAAVAVVAAAAAAAATTADAAVLAQGSRSGAAPAAFVNTATKAFPMLQGTTNLGVAGAATPMRIVVGLAMRNRPLVDMILRRQVTAGDMLYGHFLTPSQSNMLFSPSGSQVQAVATYLKESGFTNIAVTGDNMLVTADGTAAVASKAFNTQINILRVNGKRIFANVTNAQVPSSLGGTVTAVLGLNNLPMHLGPKFAAHQSLAAAPPCQTSDPVTGRCLLNSYTATGFQLAYDSPQNGGNTNTWGFTGKSTNIAIFAEGKITNVLTDLRTYEAKSVPVLPKVPVQVINAGIPSPDVSGQDEFDLDTQTSTGIAGNVKKLYLYVATSLTDADTSREFDQFALDDYAKAGSASFGECEIFPALDGALVLDDTIFARAAVQGQTIFSSAGDNGTTCPVVASTGVPGTGLPFQSYPGTSPYVVSVGGTTLITNTADGTYNSEIAWIGTGGGSSTEENSPFWQQGVVPAVDNPPSPVPGASTFKAVPDVAMDADPNTGALVYVNGVATGVGGTSLASPLSLGVWARLETLHNNTLGFASPLYYQEYKNNTTNTAGIYLPPTPPVGALDQFIGGFHDVLIGTNGLPAGPGFDYTTGLGTFDITKQFKYLPTTYPH